MWTSKQILRRFDLSQNNKLTYWHGQADVSYLAVKSWRWNAPDLSKLAATAHDCSSCGSDQRQVFDRQRARSLLAFDICLSAAYLTVWRWLDLFTCVTNQPNGHAWSPQTAWIRWTESRHRFIDLSAALAAVTSHADRQQPTNDSNSVHWFSKNIVLTLHRPLVRRTVLF